MKCLFCPRKAHILFGLHHRVFTCIIHFNRFRRNCNRLKYQRIL
jgi:hypothetical protein